MEKRKIAAIITIAVLVSAGTGLAAYIIISNTLDYDVVVEGLPITILEVTGPSAPLARGVNHTYHLTATVNSGTWQCNFYLNLTSPMITNDTYLLDFKAYWNDTLLWNAWFADTPDTYSCNQIIGTVSEGQVLDINWTVYFAPNMPTGDYAITIYIYGEAQ